MSATARQFRETVRSFDTKDWSRLTPFAPGESCRYESEPLFPNTEDYVIVDGREVTSHAGVVVIQGAYLPDADADRVVLASTQESTGNSSNNYARGSALTLGQNVFVVHGGYPLADDSIPLEIEPIRESDDRLSIYYARGDELTLGQNVFVVHGGYISEEEITLPQLTKRLSCAFEDFPLEDGMNHPAEVIIGRALECPEHNDALGWLKELSLDHAYPNFGSSVLRCLGRQNRPGTLDWRAGLLRDAMAVDDVQIRDAAVQAAESWADRVLHDILESHSESVPWLRDYIRDVMDDVAWD